MAVTHPCSSTCRTRSCARNSSNDAGLCACAIFGVTCSNHAYRARSALAIAGAQSQKVSSRSNDNTFMTFKSAFMAIYSPASNNTCIRLGPCAPISNVCSISAVRDGPVMKFTARGKISRSRSSGNTSSTCFVTCDSRKTTM